MVRRNRVVGMMALCLVLVGAGATAQLGSILKGGGIVFVVSKFGPQINSFMNRLTKTDTKHGTFDTKVVPILSAGTGTYAGAVQVEGPRNEVRLVQAVAQIEGNFRGIGVRVRGLIPIATKSITNIKRVPGVGVSGLVDVKL